MDEGIEATLGPERAAKFRKLMEARGARQTKTTTAGGAYMASQVNSKEKIGSAAAYTTPEEREGHLGEFLRGAHAFVSNDAYLKIRGKHLTEANFNVWGAGSNFVAPLADADKLVEAAPAEGGRGLFQLEEELGIPKLFWVNQCKSADYGIWRFKILKPEALNLRIPSGGEYGAYGSWVQGRCRPSRGVAPRRTDLGRRQGGRDRPGRRRQVWRVGTRVPVWPPATRLAELEKDGIQSTTETRHPAKLTGQRLPWPRPQLPTNIAGDHQLLRFVGGAGWRRLVSGQRMSDRAEPVRDRHCCAPDHDVAKRGAA